MLLPQTEAKYIFHYHPTQTNPTVLVSFPSIIFPSVLVFLQIRRIRNETVDSNTADLLTFLLAQSYGGNNSFL